jgi:hypothetical protein
MPNPPERSPSPPPAYDTQNVVPSGTQPLPTILFSSETPPPAYTQPHVPPATQSLPTISFSSETPPPSDGDPKDAVGGEMLVEAKKEKMLFKAKKEEMKDAAEETQKAVSRGDTGWDAVARSIEWAKGLGRKRK